MNPPPSSDVETPSGASEPADPRALTLHLEVCRMQTELEVLERRIGQYERAESTGVGPHDPFAERAEDLVQRMVDALYAIGRTEIAMSSEATQAAADEAVAAARRRAQEILVSARAELAEALTRRADAHDAESLQPADLVDLTDEGADEPVVVLAEAIGSPTVTLPVESPEPVDAEAVDAETVDAEVVDAVDPEGDQAAEPVAEIDALGAATVVEPEPTTEAEVGVDAPDAVGEDEPEATADVATDEAVESEAVEPEVLEPEAVELVTDDADGPDPATTQSEAEPTTEVKAPALFLPPSGFVAEPVGDDRGWPPPAPAPTAAPTAPPATPSAAQVETQRTDDAFDAWLAVAPPPGSADTDVTAAEPRPDDDSSSRPRWVRPLEAGAALLAVLVLVLLAILVLL